MSFRGFKDEPEDNISVAEARTFLRSNVWISFPHQYLPGVSRNRMVGA